MTSDRGSQKFIRLDMYCTCSKIINKGSYIHKLTFGHLRAQLLTVFPDICLKNTSFFLFFFWNTCKNACQCCQKICSKFQVASENSDEYCMLYWQIVNCIALRFHVTSSGCSLGNRALEKIGLILRNLSSKPSFIFSVLLLLLIRQVYNLKKPFFLAHVKLIHFLLSFYLYNLHASCWASAFNNYELCRWVFDSFLKKNFLYFVI